MKVGILGCLGVAALVALGAAKEQVAGKVEAGSPQEILLVVNGATLTRGEVEADVTKMLETRKGRIPSGQIDKAREALRKQMAQQFMMKTLLKGEAAKKGISVSADDRQKAEADFARTNAARPDAPKSLAEFAEKYPLGKDRAMQEFEDSILIKKLFELEVASKIKVDPKTVEQTIQNIVSNNAVQAQKALTAEADIKALKKQLEGLKGEALTKKFAELAKAKSDCPSKEKGGDLGEFMHGQMVKEFDEVAFKSEPFTVSDPVKTRFGWHLIMVTKKIPAVEAKGDVPASPEKVRASHILVMARESQKVPTKEQVEQGLKRREEQGAIRKYLTALQSAAKIEAPGFPDLLSKAPRARPAPRKRPRKSSVIESKPVELKTVPKSRPIESKPVEVKR